MKKFSNKNLTEIEYLIIEKVKAIRIKQNMSRQELSKKMGLAVSFVGKVEKYSFKDKYNIRHLALLAKALEIENPSEFLPQKTPKYDKVEIIYIRKPKTNKDGSDSKQFDEKVIEVKQLK